MSRIPRWTAARWLWAVVLLSPGLAPYAPAQGGSRSPRIGYVYPAGGRQGATVEVTIGGQFLDGAAAVLVSGGGVQAAVTEHVKPLTAKETGELRERLKALTDRRAAALPARKGRGEPVASQGEASSGQAALWTADDEKEMAQIRRRLAAFALRSLNPAISEVLSLRVTLAGDLEPGDRELRVLTRAGLTNPLTFQVGQLPEVREAAPAVEAGPRFPGGPDAGTPRGGRTPELPVQVALPAVVNGQILQGDVDRFSFSARRGQRLVFTVAARRLIPYLADAVPGWFQATLEIHDPDGRELAYADDDRFHPDPVIGLEVPADGEYVVEIRDAIYRGREDFVYRLTMGELPFVTSIFPLGGPVGARTRIGLKGWNLPEAALDLESTADEPGIRTVLSRSGAFVSNRVPFAVDTLPESFEEEPAGGTGGAPSVELPIIVNGRIDPAGDLDEFCFEGHAGSEIVAEVHARRLDSPLDSLLRVTDSTGRELASSDDREDPGAGLLTHHADSWLRVTLPADGIYHVLLRDAQHGGGGDHAYRLRIGPPRADFELRVVPSTINARGGASVPVSVHAIRRDGFSGEIELALIDAPPGFRLNGGRIPGDKDRIPLTLSVPPAPGGDPFSLRIGGRATIEGREVLRLAVPADERMQAFAYKHLVPAQELRVAVSGPPQNAAARVLGETPVRIPAGGTARVRIAMPGGKLPGNIQLRLQDPPDGIAIQTVAAFPRGTEIVLVSDASRVKAGLRGNLIVTATGGRPGAPGKASSKKAAKAKQRPAPPVTLPAIPFEIVEAVASF